jgi:hypothetical protein
VAGNPLPESSLLRGDLPNEEYPEDPKKASVKRLSWSPNEIELAIDAKEATTIYVNQNWAPEWRSSVGTVKSVEKLLAIDVPAGSYKLVLAYKDRALMACLSVSLLSLLVLLFVFAREGLRWMRAESARWSTLATWPDELPVEGEPAPSESAAASESADGTESAAASESADAKDPDATDADATDADATDADAS